MVKHLPAMQETQVRSLGQEDPLEKEILSGESHGQRSLVGYSQWGHKESDTTEWLTHTHTHPICITYILIYGNRKMLHFTIICTWRRMIHFPSVNRDFLEHDTLHHFPRQRFRERNFITELDSLSFLTISGKLLCIHTYIRTLHWLIHLSSFIHSPLIKLSSHLPRTTSMVFLPLVPQQSNPIFRLLPGQILFLQYLRTIHWLQKNPSQCGPNLPFQIHSQLNTLMVSCLSDT